MLLVALNVWLHLGSGQPTDQALHAAIEAGDGGAEVTFTAKVIGSPAHVGDHEHIQVEDAAGDEFELDYNLTLGSWVPVRAGSPIEAQGQLYDDSGTFGVHCLHAETSHGCPDPGWIKFNGATYS